jgi:phosphohistidine phosphatase
VDPERPLSELGRADVERVAEFLKRAGIRLTRVAHSGKTRARQTAELLAAAVAPDSEAESRSGIDPRDPVEPVAEEAASWSQDVMLVGHLPFLGRLASQLISPGGQLEAVAFQPGSVVCLDRGAEGSWTLAWMIRPELLVSLSDTERRPEE